MSAQKQQCKTAIKEQPSISLRGNDVPLKQSTGKKRSIKEVYKIGNSSNKKQLNA
jgi:hypothetical protein